MKVTTEHTNDTTAKVTIIGEPTELEAVKKHVLKDLAAKRGNVPGFRQGKAPLALIEKQLDPGLVQSEFLEHAVNDLYIKAVNAEDLRTVSQPKVEIKKFVPFDALEFTAEVEVVGKIEIANYKNVSVSKQKSEVTAKDIEEVIRQLKQRDSEKKDVERAAKDGDQVIIDFKGVDAKTKDPIAGADGKDYPLVLGSNSFIPGFEPELIGMKAGEEKSFDITFPEDYSVKALQNKKVTFTVTVNKVQEVVEPESNDAFAAKVGPFKNMAELKADIKKQLTQERENESERAYENQLIMTIADKSKVALPKVLIDDQLDRMEQEEKQNLMYRGQTWQEHLKAEGVTEEAHRERNREQAEQRVKAGIILSEIAEAEQVNVSSEELNMQIQILKSQYKDPQMQTELDKPDNQRDIMNRMITQKTVEKIKEFNQKNTKKTNDK